MKRTYTIAAFFLFPVLAVVARNKIISPIFILAWILLLPVCAAYVVKWHRGRESDDRISSFERSIMRIPILLFGTIATIIGTAVLLWVFYGLFVEGQMQYDGLPTILGGLGGGTALIALGIYLIRLATAHKLGGEP